MDSTTNSKTTVVMTIALPYANGGLHLGHIVEAVQADAKARFLRMTGHEVIFLCADDNHGTAIEIKAAQESVTPEALIDRIWVEHRRDYERYQISFDAYHRTHSSENEEICRAFYDALKSRDLIVRADVEQLFDPSAGRFLSDRYIAGTCPRCHADNQYGDGCESCGATYQATELVNPRSRLSNATPVVRSSEHLFLSLNSLAESLREWTRSGALQAPVVAKLDEWFDAGLRDWDISRDAPYFGFEIPGEPGKFFYVWLDAPIGYLAALESYCKTAGGSWRDYWSAGATADLHHFIGKDIANFHVCFWPCLLEGAGYRRPTKVFCHGFLTVNGRKMSKSRGTFVTAQDFADHIDPDYFRYYAAALLSCGIDDIDLNPSELVARINSDLIGKFVNLAARCDRLLHASSNRVLAVTLKSPDLYEDLVKLVTKVREDYASHETGAVVRSVMTHLSEVNRFLEVNGPWRAGVLPSEVQLVVSQALFHFRAVAILLSPIIPALSARALEYLQEPAQENASWSSILSAPFGRQLKAFQPLASRLELDDLHKVLPIENVQRERKHP